MLDVIPRLSTEAQTSNVHKRKSSFTTRSSRRCFPVLASARATEIKKNKKNKKKQRKNKGRKMQKKKQ